MSKTLTIYQVDAFTSRIFGGNPAAIVPLEQWIDDALMQNIATENNLAETAFIVPNEQGFHLRWFTPAAEVRLCGHATLATAHVLFQHLGYDKEQIVFDTLSGPLYVSKMEDGYRMDFPADYPEVSDRLDDIVQAVGYPPKALFTGKDDYLAIFDQEDIIARIIPDQLVIAGLGQRGLIISAPGNEVDFVSRCFFPNYGIPEDPTTGSAHCLMTPYWAKQLGKNSLSARQISARVGDLKCHLQEDRVLLEGAARTYMIGEIWVD